MNISHAFWSWSIGLSIVVEIRRLAWYVGMVMRIGAIFTKDFLTIIHKGNTEESTIGQKSSQNEQASQVWTHRRGRKKQVLQERGVSNIMVQITRQNIDCPWTVWEKRPSQPLYTAIRARRKAIRTPQGTQPPRPKLGFSVGRPVCRSIVPEDSHIVDKVVGIRM